MPMPTLAGAKKAGRKIAMRPRRVLVKTHRWIAFALMAWLLVVAFTGGWLAIQDNIASWVHGDRYHSTEGDVGPDAAVAAAAEVLPEHAEIYGTAMPSDGRGVYQVGAEIPLDPDAEVPEGEEAPAYYVTVYVDPGSGEVNGIANEEEGFSWWLYRGHMYLWQDHGPFNAFGSHGWCMDGNGGEEGGVVGVVCDVVPNDMDVVAWFGVGWIVVLLTGFYLWYWPGVRRWATAFVIRRGRGAFTFNMSLHKVVGFVVWIPLLVVSFTGIAFAFPNLNSWYENVTPSQRDFSLWSTPEDAVSGAAE